MAQPVAAVDYLAAVLGALAQGNQQPDLGFLTGLPPDLLRNIQDRLAQEEQHAAGAGAAPDSDDDLSDDNWPNPAAAAPATPGAGAGRLGGPRAGIPLQDDVLRIILGMVFSEERDPGAMSGMRLLGRQWQRLVGTEVHSITPAAVECVAQLCMFPALQRLDLRRAAAADRISPAVLEHLPHALQELTALDFGGWRSLSWNQVAAAAKLRRLASLSLTGCHELPGVCLAELTPLARSLTRLNLAGCSQLRDADLPCVGELTSLRALRLFGCSALTDEGIGALQPLGGRLAYLDIGKCALGLTRLGADSCARRGSGEGQSNLATLSRLQRLDCNSHLPGIDGDDEGPDVLAALATLQHLSASHVVDNADRLSRCSALTALTAVELQHMGLLNSGAVAAAVVGWPRLRRLRLTACVNLGDATMEAVAAHAPGLTFLDVSRCHNGMNSEIAALVGLRLTRLETLACQPPSAMSLAPLASLPRLRDLDLGGPATFEMQPLCEVLGAATNLTRLGICVRAVGATSDDGGSGGGSVAALEQLSRLRALALTLHLRLCPHPEQRELAAALVRLTHLTALTLAPHPEQAGRPAHRLRLRVLRAAARLPRLRTLVLDDNACWTARRQRLPTVTGLQRRPAVSCAGEPRCCKHDGTRVTTALRPAAQLRVLSVARCGLAALEQRAHEFAAHPYLRINTGAAPAWQGGGGDSDDDDM